MQGEIGSIFGIVKEVDVSARLRVKIKGLSVSRFEDEVRLKGGSCRCNWEDWNWEDRNGDCTSHFVNGRDCKIQVVTRIGVESVGHFERVCDQVHKDQYMCVTSA